MARRIIHCCLDITGGILHAKDLRGNITVNGRILRTEKEVRNFLQSELDKGRRVLPLCDCEGFDYQKGCPGHIIPDPPEVEL